MFSVQLLLSCVAFGRVKKGVSKVEAVDWAGIVKFVTPGGNGLISNCRIQNPSIRLIRRTGARALSMHSFWVAKLAKSFGLRRIPESLGDFRHEVNPNHQD